jgi:hypothetical protein
VESIRRVRRLRTVLAAGLVAGASLVGVVTSRSAKADTEATPRPEGSYPITACATPTYFETYGPWVSVRVGFLRPGVYDQQDVRFEVDGQTIASSPVRSYEGSLEGILEFPRPGTYVGDLVYEGGAGIPAFRRRTTMVVGPVQLPFFDSIYRSVLSAFPGTLSLTVAFAAQPRAQLTRDGVVIEPSSTQTFANPLRLVKTYEGLDPTVFYLAEMDGIVGVGIQEGIRDWPSEQRRLVQANGSYFPNASIRIPGFFRTECSSGAEVEVLVEGVGRSNSFEVDGRPFKSGGLLSPGTHTIRVTDAFVPIERVVEIPPPDPRNFTFTSGYVYPDYSVHPIDPPWVTTLPTTVPPTTVVPVTAPPTTAPPTTAPPTTAPPTTAPPTTAPPTTTPPPPVTTTTTVVSPPTTSNPPSSGSFAITCPAGSLNIGDEIVVSTNAATPGSSVALTANGVPLGTTIADSSGRASVRNNLWMSGPVTLVFTESVFQSGVEKRRSGSCSLASFDSRVATSPTLRVPESVQIGKPFTVSVTGIARSSGRVDFYVGSTPAGSVPVTGSAIEFTTTAWSTTQKVITAVWVDFDRGTEFQRSVSSNIRVEL